MPQILIASLIITWSHITQHCVLYTMTEIRHAVQCQYNMVNYLANSQEIHPIACPLGRGMGCILCLNSDLYLASVTAVMYAISCYTGPRYNQGSRTFRRTKFKIFSRLFPDHFCDFQDRFLSYLINNMLPRKGCKTQSKTELISN